MNTHTVFVPDNNITESSATLDMLTNNSLIEINGDHGVGKSVVILRLLHTFKNKISQLPDTLTPPTILYFVPRHKFVHTVETMHADKGLVNSDVSLRIIDFDVGGISTVLNTIKVHRNLGTLDGVIIDDMDELINAKELGTKLMSTQVIEALVTDKKEVLICTSSTIFYILSDATKYKMKYVNKNTRTLSHTVSLIQ